MQPTVDSGRCVHAGRVAASCVACLAVCPRSAVSLDGQPPTISERLCDGCGLCVAACPRQAIVLPLSFERGVFAGHEACFAACEKALDDIACDGRIPCLHAIGLDALLRALASGIRLWIVARGNCASCARGHGQSIRDTVARLNEALRARKTPEIALIDIDGRRWALVCATRGAPRTGRRAFLEGVLAVASPVRAGGQEAETRACFAGEGPMPHAIHLDRSRCAACHACARVCPDGAIRLEEAVPAYMLDHAACTGCGLCVDVCDRDAIRLIDWMPGKYPMLPLRAGVCRQCGTAYHAPKDTVDNRCRVCADRTVNKRLDRVWE